MAFSRSYMLEDELLPGKTVETLQDRAGLGATGGLCGKLSPAIGKKKDCKDRFLVVPSVFKTRVVDASRKLLAACPRRFPGRGNGRKVLELLGTKLAHQAE